MKSATAFTYELDDTSAAVRELVSQIREKLTLCKHTAAILHAQPDIALSEITGALSRELGCDVVGGTTAGAAVFTVEGYHEFGLVLHVLTADDCLFSAAVSEPLSDEPDKKISAVYGEALAALKAQDASAEPKFIYYVAPPVEGYPTSRGLGSLSDACGGAPVFGYIAGDDFEFCKYETFLNGETARDRAVVLLIAGNVKPVFQVENLSGRRALDKSRVTKSKDNVIYEIDGKPAYEYITSLPFIDINNVFVWHYQFFIDSVNADGSVVSVCRSLQGCNAETGELITFDSVPEGSMVSFLYCDDKDVRASCEFALNDLKTKLGASGGEYSTVLVSSCGLRHMLLVDDKELEANCTRELLPKGVAVSGVYSFGEIAPGGGVNSTHNATYTMVAL